MEGTSFLKPSSPITVIIGVTPKSSIEIGRKEQVIEAEIESGVIGVIGVIIEWIVRIVKGIFVGVTVRIIVVISRTDRHSDRTSIASC
jgi:hypothetical protein